MVRMSRLIAILISAVALTMASQTYSYSNEIDTKRAEASLVDAVALYNDGKPEDALKLLRPIAAVMPDNDAAFYYMGLCHTALRDLESAVSCMQEASRLDPSNRWYKERLARLYTFNYQPELAAAIYEELLGDDPKNVDIYYALTQLYAQQNKADKVLELLDEIESVSGKSEMVSLTKYDVLMRQQKPEEAYKELERYNEEFSSAEVLAAMGEHNLQQFKDTLALKYYTEALSYDSQCTAALVGLSEVYRIRRNYPEFFASVNQFVTNADTPVEQKSRYVLSMLQHSDPQFIQSFKVNLDFLMDSYLAQAPSDSTVLRTCGSYFFSTGDIAKALDMFKRCSDLLPDSQTSREMYVDVLSSSGEWEQLREQAERGFKDFPQQPAFLQFKIQADFNLEDYPAIVEDCRRVIAAAPGDTSSVVMAYSSMGDAYHVLGESKKAYSAYDKALKLVPDYNPVLNNYAYYLSEENRKLRKAYAMSKVTVESEPDNPTYLDTFAWILHLLGKDVEAKPFFKHAMLYGGKESATILDHYAEVLYALGEYDLAKVYWNMAKNKNSDGSVPDLDARVQARLESLETK